MVLGSLQEANPLENRGYPDYDSTAFYHMCGPTICFNRNRFTLTAIKILTEQIQMMQHLE